MISKRNSDKFKFWTLLSIIAVVFIHGYNLKVRYLGPFSTVDDPLTATNFTEFFLSNGIFRFCIPLLFLISGYLYAMHDQRSNLERIKKRTRTLLLPYLLWSGLYILILYFFEMPSAVTNWVGQFVPPALGGHVRTYSWQAIVFSWLLFPFAFQLWFIRALFIFNLAYPLLKRLVTGPIAKWIYFSIVFLFWFAPIFPILFDGESLLFFSLGVWIQKSNFDIDTPGRWFNPRWWMLGFIGAAILKTWLAFKGMAILGNNVTPLLVLLHKFVVASGVIVVWFGGNALVEYCMASKRFVWLTSFSFMIYVVHAPLISVTIDPVLNMLGFVAGYQLLTYIFLPLAIIIFAIGLGALLRKIVPPVYDVLTGGRGF